MKKVVISSVITAVGALLLCAIIIGACIYSGFNQPGNLDFWYSAFDTDGGLALGFPFFISFAIFLFGLISLLTQFFQKD